jgi:hypothetical protein
MTRIRIRQNQGYGGQVNADREGRRCRNSKSNCELTADDADNADDGLRPKGKSNCEEYLDADERGSSFAKAAADK